MIKINFIPHNGDAITVEANPGDSLMAVAIDNGVPGIDADCGGACCCATCHVFVDQQWLTKVGSPRSDEESLLSLHPDRRDSSRLSCQIQLKEEHDGLTVSLPEFQF